MTKEITKAFILQQIQDKFKLRELEPEVFSFSEQVIPVYNIEQHLQTWETKETQLSITSATSFEAYVVPETERWLLRAYQLIFYAEGAYKVSGVFVSQRPKGAGNYIYLDLAKGQTTSYLVTLPTPVVLEPGNKLYVLIDTYVSTASLDVILDVQKEEIR